MVLLYSSYFGEYSQNGARVLSQYLVIALKQLVGQLYYCSCSEKRNTSKRETFEKYNYLYTGEKEAVTMHGK